MTTLTTTAPSLASGLMPLVGTAGGFIVLVAIGFVGGIGAIMTMM